MRRISLPLALASTMVLAASGAAQAPWLSVDRSPRLAAEIFKPGFDDNAEFRAASSTLYLSGRFPAGRTVFFVAELPVAFGGFRYDSDASAQIGNPYVGIEGGQIDGSVWGEFGGRLPVVGSDPNSGIIVGAYSDIDRFGAFQPRTATLSAALNVGSRSQTGTGIRARVGPELWLRTSDQYSDKTEFLLNYGAQVYHVAGAFEGYIHAGGLAIMSEDNANFGERSLHQLGFGASYRVGGVRPGLVLRLPLDSDLQNALNYVLGLTLQVPLR